MTQSPLEPLSLTLSPAPVRPLSPLNLPELLQRVFSFIDRYTVANTVVHVCRQWLLLNHHRLSREITWDVNWQPSQPKYALTGLPGSERLVLNCCQSGFEWRGPDLPKALVALQRPPSRWSTLSRWYWSTSKSITGFSDRPLREIVLTVSNNCTDDWIYNLAFPQSLTSLTIDKTPWASLDVGRILAICPLLEHLYLSSSLVADSWTSRGKEALPERLPLRSLVLKRPYNSQSWIEDLLTITPDLEDLKLIGIVKNGNEQPWNWRHFCDHLQSLSLPLKQFHYSTAKVFPTEYELEEMAFAICPNAKERTFLLYNLTSRVLSGLMEQLVFLTALDILLPDHPNCHSDGWLLHYLDDGSRYTALPLHQLLCEGSVLRHLKILKMPYMADLLDLFHRNTMYGTVNVMQEISALTVPGIWICQDLETLHLELHSHGVGRRRKLQNFRIACGYISRVCPHLQDLHIMLPPNCMYPNITGPVYSQLYDLQAGLCLLSRLRSLERLRLECLGSKCDISEINWLCRSGRTAEHRARRKAIVDGWGDRLETEAILSEGARQMYNTTPHVILGPRANDEQLMKSLNNLGLLKDVKEMVEEMDTDEYVCLPELRRLACGHHLEQSPEKELRSLFYVGPGGMTA